jgi:uncharacterized membrane protein YfcA
MYNSLLFLHSIFRWLVLISLLYALLRAYHGYKNKRSFARADNSTRHWAATIAHVQLILGFTLYLISPLVKYFYTARSESRTTGEPLFFGMVHIAVMLSAIVVITIGSSLAKRRETDPEKFRTMLVWFSVALLLILAAIPWPFSPFAQRPYLRPF